MKHAPVPALSTSSDVEAEAVLVSVEAVHQFHGADCLCGYSSDVSRDRTKHITTETEAAFNRAGWRPPAAVEEFAVMQERVQFLRAQVESLSDEKARLGVDLRDERRAAALSTPPTEGTWERVHDQVCRLGDVCSAHQPGNWPLLVLSQPYPNTPSVPGAVGAGSAVKALPDAWDEYAGTLKVTNEQNYTRIGLAIAAKELRAAIAQDADRTGSAEECGAVDGWICTLPPDHAVDHAAYGFPDEPPLHTNRLHCECVQGPHGGFTCEGCR